MRVEYKAPRTTIGQLKAGERCKLRSRGDLLMRIACVDRVNTVGMVNLQTGDFDYMIKDTPCRNEGDGFPTQLKVRDIPYGECLSLAKYGFNMICMRLQSTQAFVNIRSNRPDSPRAKVLDLETGKIHNVHHNDDCIAINCKVVNA